jgi:hypothetical protein
MTEAEWLACADPTAMLEFLRGKSSDRKLTLFATACCRRIWQFLLEAQSRKAVEVAERFADGEATEEELADAAEAAEQVASSPSSWTAQDDAGYAAEPGVWAAAYAAGLDNQGATEQAADAAGGAAANKAADAAAELGDDTQAAAMNAVRPAVFAELEAQAFLVRSIFGNPYRPSPALPSAVLAWNDRTIPRLAEAVYDDRQMPAGTLDPGHLAILADALLDAGCDDEALLAHLRSPGPHVRGCWAVDLILRKS